MYEKIEAKNISYRYPLINDYRIKNVNFIMNEGKKCFCREKRCGKTTFIKLLTGMLEHTDGAILINNTDKKI